MADAKQHGINISISTVATLIPVLGVVWFFVQPALVGSVSEAVASEFDTQIKQQTAPIQGAFKVLLLSEINSLKKEIAQLEFKEEHEPDEWTADDAAYRANLKIELAALQEAYGEL